MVRVDGVLAGIRRGIEQSNRMPSDTSYRERTIDAEGVDSDATLPNVTITEISTVQDESRSTGLVGYVRDDAGDIIGRIFEAGFDMEVQIDVHVAAGDTPGIKELQNRVRLALWQYDSRFRSDLFPDGAGGGIGDIRNFQLGQSVPADDLTQTPSMRRQRLEASIVFVERLNEVDEYGPLEPIKEVRTPRDGDYVGDISEDYDIEYHPET